MCDFDVVDFVDEETQLGSMRVCTYFQLAVNKILSQEPDSPAGFCCTFLRRHNATLSPKMV